MTVAELIEKLKMCQQDATIEDICGEKVNAVWEHRKMKRVLLENKTDMPEAIAPGWMEI